jgi:tetratricopeptide (TPR) repeat protein
MTATLSSHDRPPFRLVLHAQRGGTAPAVGDVDAVSADAAAADERAVGTFREALQEDPGEADYHYLLGEALLRLGRPREALPELTEAVRLHPQDAAYHDALGCALWHHRRFDEASTAFQEAIRLSPEHTAALSGLGGVLVEMGRPKQAIEALQRAIRIDGTDGRLYTNLAIAQWHVGVPDEALRSFARAAQLRAPSAAVQRNLAIALSARGEATAALAAFEKAVSLRPSDAQARADLGDALFAAGRRADAEAVFDEVVKVEPSCLAERPQSRQAREAMVSDRLRQEMRAEHSPAGVQERGWAALFASRGGLGALFGVARRLPTAVGLLIALAVLRAGWVLVPPYVRNYTFGDKVTEIARAPVHDDADVLERLMHEVDERRLGPLIQPGSFQIETAPKWRRITCAYSVPVRVFPGWSTTLRFRVHAEEPYVVFARTESGRIVIPDER